MTDEELDRIDAIFTPLLPGAAVFGVITRLPVPPEIAVILPLVKEAVTELRRLRRGEVTPEEVHNFCHNLSDTVTIEEFADGCSREMVKLFGGPAVAEYAVRKLRGY